MAWGTLFLITFSTEVVFGMFIATASHLAKWEMGVRTGLTVFGVGAVGMLILALASFINALALA